jgi:hypothetical protein
MANPTGHTYHYGEHKPLQEKGGPAIVYRQGEAPWAGQMQTPRRLNRPSWYGQFPRVAQRLEDAGQLVQRYPWGFFVLGMVAGGLYGCYGRKIL